MASIQIHGQTVQLADPDKVPLINEFDGRKEELMRCRAAWGIGRQKSRLADASYRLHFRLQGLPGVGKNEIVYEIVRQIQTLEKDVPFYMIQGHEELTPEDLGLLLVPEAAKQPESVALGLRASPLATAIMKGGLFFFDEINRVPERALAPLASVLDDRQYLYSAMTGLRIEPEDDVARRRFRFCCALNPLFSESGKGGLPDYIEERTLPVIDIRPQPFEEVCAIIEKNLKPTDPAYLQEFRRRFDSDAHREMSVRKALSFMRYAMNYANSSGDIGQAFDAVEEGVMSALAGGRRASFQDSESEYDA